MAWELLRQSSKPAKRVDSKGLARIRNQSITHSFGILVASEAALYVLRAVYVCIYGMPNEDINQTSNLYTLTAVAGVIYVIVDGLFYLSQALRASDYLGRLGGDEFLIVLPNTASGQAEAIGARLLHVVSTVGLQDWTECITLSVGIAEAAVGDDASILLKRADDALYKAKRGGRNCVRTAAKELVLK